MGSGRDAAAADDGESAEGHGPPVRADAGGPLAFGAGDGVRRSAPAAAAFIGQNPPRGAQLFYSLTKKADKVTLKVVDIAGKTIKELPAKAVAPGLHRIAWDLTGTTPVPVSSEGGGSGPPRQRRRPPGQTPLRPVAAGSYRVVLTVDGKEWTQNIRVEPDPTVPMAVIAPEEEESNADMDKDG